MRDVSPGGDRRTITVTFGYPDGLRTLVAKNLRGALDQAVEQWGRWRTIESISTPSTIYADLIGHTRARLQPGTYRGGVSSVLSKLRSIGYEPEPGEVATVRYARTELPTTYRGKRHPDRLPPTHFDDDEHGKRANREQ